MTVKTRVFLIAWACLLCFGLALESNKAYALDGGGDCFDACDEACEESGGCEYFDPRGCGCSFICSDGTEGSLICT